MIMKKIIGLSLIVGSLAFAVPAAEAKIGTASANAADPQIRVQIGPQRNRRWRNNRVYVTTTTRIVGFGRNRFREVIRVTHYPNGRVSTQVISRTRIGRNW